mgnify:CR=1 FL=1
MHGTIVQMHFPLSERLSASSVQDWDTRSWTDRQYRDLRYDRQASIDIFRDAIDKMVDHSCDVKTEESMKREILKVPGVRRVDLLKTRLFGSKMYVDIEIAADGNISLCDAHDIAENVHHTIENKFKDVKHCMVHVNPING